jgi:hypothetical protein
MRAVDKLGWPNATIACDITLDGSLILKISVIEAIPTVDRITPSSFYAAKRHANGVVQEFERLHGEVSRDFVNTRGVGRRIGFSYTSPYSYREPRDFFEISDLKTEATTVEFSISPQVFAASRSRKRLDLLAERSIFDYHESTRRDQPRPDQYSVARSEEFRSLRVSSSDEEIAENVTAALLSEPYARRPFRRSIDYWPPATTPYWGGWTLILAGFSLVIAPFRVSLGLLLGTVLGLTISVGFALIMSWRGGANIPKTALGMSPAGIVLGFAFYYGLLMMGRHPSVTIMTTGAPHLVDAFLLSLGMASTGGFFDLGLHTTAVRVAAFAEMLLMVSVAGSSLYVGAQAAWSKLANIVSTQAQ